MIRLWPRTLFGRLVIILVVGLLVAQIFSLVIHWRDRGRAMNRWGGMEFAHRIVDIVQRLEPLGPRERMLFARRVSDPRLRAILQPRFQSVAPPAERDTSSATLIESRLRRHLGDRRPLQVVVSERPFRRLLPRPPPWPPDPHRTGGRRGPLFFLARVGLGDGAAVDFHFRLARESLNWPVRMLVSLAILVVSILLLAMIAVRQTTRPLSMLARAADNLGRDINRPSLAEDRGPREVRQAARAFNHMQRQIQRYVEDRTKLLAAVSHDLKTPITRLRIRTELLEDAALRDKFGADLDEMELMVNETLEFMRGIDQRESVQPIDIGALLESITADAQQRGGRVELELPAIAPYPGRPVALKRCLTNLVDNALKYGGQARITATDHTELLRLAIADRGPGIPADQLERVFEPFYRLEPSRSKMTGGAGLGLAIARNIARAHGGDITLANGPEGGLIASLRLPRTGAA